MRTTYYTTMDSPIGELFLAGKDALQRIEFAKGKGRFGPQAGWKEDARPFRDVAHQLRAYFAGELRDFDTPIDLGGTVFQRRTWQALRRIPYGETATYGEIARRIGRPTATRAVGAANGRNPIPIIVPCHRVIGSDGTLTGFAAGTDIKRKLLKIEGVAL